MTSFKTITLLAFLSFPALCNACPKPDWVEDPNILNSNCYFVGIGKGKTPSIATESAWAHVQRQLAMTNVRRIEAQQIDTLTEKNGKIEETFSERIRADGYYYSQTGEKIFRVMESYQSPAPCEEGEYVHCILVCTDIEGCKCQKRNTSYLGNVVRSVFIPGWGQLAKGENKKGYLFLGGELFMIAGAAACNDLVATTDAKAKAATQKSDRVHYSDLSNTYYYSALFFIGAGATIYGYNIFDAIFSKKGKMLYVLPDKQEIGIRITLGGK